MVFLAPGVQADSLEAWVARRIQVQRESKLASPAVTGQTLWRDRSDGSPGGIAGFRAPSSFAPLVKAVQPTVVHIRSQVGESSQRIASGFVIHPDGFIVTNAHVIDGAMSIVVRLPDDREFQASIVGSDRSTDVALLKLSGVAGLETVVLGDSDRLEVGDWIVAIGNPLGLDLSVTHGVVSALERVIGMGPFDDFIQTNATINPGNSGGPLFDMRGEVVGVATAIVRSGQGIGFAVPVNILKDLLPNLLDNGQIDRGWLGVNVREQWIDGDSVPVIVEVFEASPAKEAGLRVGDRLLALGDKTVTGYRQLMRRVALIAPGTRVKIGYWREGRKMNANVVLEKRPPPRESILGDRDH